MIITPKGNLAKVNIVEPVTYEGGQSRYYVAVHFPDEKELGDLRIAIASAANEKFTEEVDNLKIPLVRDAMFTTLRCYSKHRPGIAIHKRDLKGKTREELEEYYQLFQEESVVKLAITFHGYNYKNNKGVKAQLHHICLFDEDQPLTSAKLANVDWG